AGAVQRRAGPGAPRPDPPERARHAGDRRSRRARGESPPDRAGPRARAAGHPAGARVPREPGLADGVPGGAGSRDLPGARPLHLPRLLTKAESGKVVPTWNYAVVHAYGSLSVVEDAAWLSRLVEQLTHRFEAGRPRPWQVTDAPRDFIETQLKAIVGLEIRLTRLDGKWKVSQNRAPRDRAGVVDGLRTADDPGSRAMAELV